MRHLPVILVMTLLLPACRKHSGGTGGAPGYRYVFGIFVTGDPLQSP